MIDDSDGDDIKYTLRITEHINDIVVRDSANASLGLSLTSDIQSIASIEAILDEGKVDLPVATNTVPFGTILFGPNIEATDPNFDKRLKLEIFYTEVQ